jgi:hypothetical protein
VPLLLQLVATAAVLGILTLLVCVGPALIQAHQSGMSVIIKEAMANGRLTPRNTDVSFAAQLQLLCKAAQEVGLIIAD